MRSSLLHILLPAALLLAPYAASAESPSPTTLDLSASAEARAENDVVRATLYYEATDSDPAALAQEVNTAIREALDLAGQHDDVRTRSAGTSTYPVRTKDGQDIEAWRMRSSIQLESEAIDTASELIGELQQTLALGSVIMEPAAKTHAAAADAAALDALEAFRARAATLAAQLGSDYRIQHLTVQHDRSSPPVQPFMRAAMATADSAAPAPLEGGDSAFNVTIHGTIEIIE